MSVAGNGIVYRVEVILILKCLSPVIAYVKSKVREVCSDRYNIQCRKRNLPTGPQFSMARLLKSFLHTEPLETLSMEGLFSGLEVLILPAFLHGVSIGLHSCLVGSFFFLDVSYL